jgi:hypothetical protein
LYTYTILLYHANNVHLNDQSCIGRVHLIVRYFSFLVISTEPSCVQYECIFPFFRKLFRRFIRSYLCLIKFSTMNILSGLPFSFFLLLKTICRSLYVRNLVMIDILPSFGSPMGRDLPKWWMSGFKPRSLLYIPSTILSVFTGWMIQPFLFVGTFTSLLVI